MADSVYRVTEVVGVSSESWEAAARVAVETAARSVRDLRVAEVLRQDLTIENGSVVNYRFRLGISFKYESATSSGPPPFRVRSPERRLAAIVLRQPSLTISNEISRPRTCAHPIVKLGCRRLSVGLPGLKIWKPRDRIRSSSGMCEWPKITAFAPVNDRRNRSSLPLGEAGVVHDSQPDIPDRQHETLWQQRAHRGVIDVAVDGGHLSETAQLHQCA